MATGTLWTGCEEAVLREKWAAGLSASEIAALLPGRSRNAVIGRVHRLGLPPHGSGAPCKYIVRSASKPALRSLRAHTRAKPSLPPRNMHVTRIRPIPAPVAKPNKFDASPGSQIAHALLSAATRAEQRRDMYRADQWGRTL